MATILCSDFPTVRATTLSFQVFLDLLLDHCLLDCPKQFLSLPESQTDLLQSMLFALQTGDLLHVLANFGFGDEVDEELHHAMLSQKSHFHLTTSKLFKPLIDGAPVNSVRPTITMSFDPIDGSYQTFAILDDERSPLESRKRSGLPAG